MTQENHETIDRYLLGKMTPAEKSEFEQKCLSDPQLAKELAIARIEFAVMESLAEEKIRKDLQARLKKNPPKTHFTFWTNPRMYYAAAAAASLIVVVAAVKFAGHFFPNTPTPIAQNVDAPVIQQTPAPDVNTTTQTTTESIQQPQKTVKTEQIREAKPASDKALKNIAPTKNALLADRYFKDPINSLNFMSAEGSPEKTKLAQARNAYQRADFQSVIQLLSTPEPAYAKQSAFLLGTTFYRINQYEKALQQFNALSDSRIYSPYALWYGALCKLKLGENATADLQKVISMNGHPNQADAVQILKELGQQ